MSKRESASFRIAWVSLAITGVSILVFGLFGTALPDSHRAYLRTTGVASIWTGLFG